MIVKINLLSIGYSIFTLLFIGINTEEKVEVCKDAEAISQVKITARSGSELPLVEPICGDHYARRLRQCNVLEEGDKQVDLEDGITELTRIQKRQQTASCLKTNDSRVVFRSDVNYTKSSDKSYTPRRIHKSRFYDCPVNKNIQSLSIGALWKFQQRGGASLEYECWKISCAWDCMEMTEVLELKPNESVNLEAQNRYIRKYRLDKFYDAFISAVEIERQTEQEYKIAYRVCRDCSDRELIPPGDGGIPVLVISLQDCPAGWTSYLDGEVCYKSLGTVQQQPDAAAACKKAHPSADLSFFRNQEDYDIFLKFLASVGLANYPPFVWIAGSDRREEGLFEYTDRKTKKTCPIRFLSYYNGVSFPAPNYRNQDCLARGKNTEIMNDIECESTGANGDQRAATVCQIRRFKACP